VEEGPSVRQGHGLQLDPIVPAPHRPGVRAQQDLQVGVVRGRHPEIEIDGVSLIQRLRVFPAEVHAQGLGGGCDRGAAALHVEVQDQDVAPGADVLQGRTDGGEGLGDVGEDFTPQ
jgi:hypothetical protein